METRSAPKCLVEYDFDLSTSPEVQELLVEIWSFRTIGVLCIWIEWHETLSVFARPDLPQARTTLFQLIRIGHRMSIARTNRPNSL